MPGPEWIGRYRVSGFLGSGGFASVYFGTDDALGEPVAIKVLAENWANVDDVRQRFLREARLLRLADSDRVVRMYDIGELPDGRPYFVMSYADRGTVADRLTGAALPVPDALRIAVETARAVAVLHRHGVVHRDIKPSNVLMQSSVDGGERILIGDLGVAKHIAQASGFTVAAGTPGYMSPEQWEQRLDIDARADVYGLGAFTFHLLTGAKYEPGGLALLTLPTKVTNVLAQALETDREQRWPDAEAFAYALADAITDTVANTTTGALTGSGWNAAAAAARFDDPSTVPGSRGNPGTDHGAAPKKWTPGRVWRHPGGRIAAGVTALLVVGFGLAALLGAFTPEPGEPRPAAQTENTYPATITNTYSQSKKAYLGTYSYKNPFSPQRAGKGYGEGETIQIECQERNGRKISDPTEGTASKVWDRTSEGVYVSDLYTDLKKVAGPKPPNGIPNCA